MSTGKSPEGGERSAAYQIKSVPYLVINGNRHIAGVPSRERLESLLTE
jgi:predicted DsbA family dithiol-disulfide isomerase